MCTCTAANEQWLELYRVSKSVACLIFYKPELIIMFFAHNILIILASKNIYSFASNLMSNYFTFHFFRIAEMTFSHVTAAFLNIPFNKECHILIKMCIYLKNTLQRRY